MDKSITEEKKIEKLDLFMKQLKNSCYSWVQSKNIVLSSMKGFVTTEKRKKVGEMRYKSAAET